MNSVHTIPHLSPQMRQPATTRGMMADVLIALLPSLFMSAFFFGLRVLALAVISVFSCAAFEFLYRRLTHQRQTIGDLSACVTGLLLAMSLPAAASYWTPVLGAFFSIIVVKQFYGGLGKNFMNPALAGRMLLATFPMLMTTWSQPLDRLPLTVVDVVTAATPMSSLHMGELPPQSLPQLFLGYQGGSMGEVSSFMLLLGGLYLILRRVISPRIPLSYLGTAAVFALLFPRGDAGAFLWMLTQLLSGGLLFGAFFFANDPTTTPVTPLGQTLFGIGCGLFTMLLRYFSSYPEGVGWAILTMNCCVWLLDRAGRPRQFGVAPFTAFRRWLRRKHKSLAEIHFVKPDFTFVRSGKMPGEEHLDQIRTLGRSVIALVAVVAVTGTSIFVVHNLTDYAAARTENERQQKLLAQVMPKASTSSETPYIANGALSITAAYSSDNELLGHCVEVQTNGFTGVITMVVGIDTDGKVTGVAITDHHEDGVGSKATTPVALLRYIGKSGTIRLDGDNSVDTVSGATATSKAIIAGVNRALAIAAALDTEGGDELYDNQV